MGVELELFERVILRLHGEVFAVGVEARSVRDGEAREHTADLEAEVVMAPCRVMQMNHVGAAEGATFRHLDRQRVVAERLVRRSCNALASIIVELGFAGVFHQAAL